MLSLLHIENIALIESADIRFEAGFNVLTGETGAGSGVCPVRGRGQRRSLCSGGRRGGGGPERCLH